MDEQVAIRSIADSVRAHGGNPGEQFVVGSLDERAKVRRFSVVHARDLTPECESVFGSCSGWGGIYFVNMTTGVLERVQYLR